MVRVNTSNDILEDMEESIKGLLGHVDGLRRYTVRPVINSGSDGLYAGFDITVYIYPGVDRMGTQRRIYELVTRHLKLAYGSELSPVTVRVKLTPYEA